MNKSTRQFLSFMLLFLTASASWSDAKAGIGGRPAHVGNFYFLLFDNDFDTHTAVLTTKNYAGDATGSNSYSSNVVIPATIEAENKYNEMTTYTVIGIDNYAFYGSTSIKSVIIPKTVVSIGKMAFEDCTSLDQITVDPENQKYYTKDNVLYDFAQTELIVCAKTKTGKFTVPGDVQKIDEYAFQGCTEITEIVLPNGLKNIEEGAFSGCSKLTSINIPSSLTSLGSSAFKGCTSLTSINLPTSVNSIGTSAFENTGLTSISIPKDITEIQASTFSGCKLTSITLPEGLKVIGQKAFYNNGTTIENVEIPESVTTIGANAFNGTNVNHFYINNIPSKIALAADTPFNTNTTIHVFTQMESIFQNAANWSNYAGHFLADIDIVHVESIELDNITMVVLKTKVGKLTATISPENARVKDVVFTSSNDAAILIVDPTAGTFVAGDEEGTAIITCTTTDGTGLSARCKITVVNSFTPATSVTLNFTEKSLKISETFTLQASVSPEHATYKNITWVSSDENVATVDEDGKVTAVGPGNATITAITEDGAARATCYVTVAVRSFELADGATYERTEDSYIDELIYSRTFKSKNWQGLYVPFDMSYDDWKDNFDVAIVNNIHQFDDDDDGTIDRTLIEVVKQKDGKTIKAHTPCVIRAKEPSDDPQTIVVNNTYLRKAEYKYIDCASVSTKYVFYGTYRPMDGTELVASNYYVLTSGGIREGRADDRLPANRWYLDIIDRETESKLANARISIMCLDEDGTTGIETVGNDSEEIIAIFDINGRKRNGLTKGINIVKYANGSTKKITK